MGSFTNGLFGGLTCGLYNTTNILFGGLTSYSMYRSGLDPFMTLYPNLDSPSGFSSWAHPSYATPTNVILNASGFDTTWSPLTSSISNALFGGGFFGGGIFGWGFPTGGTFMMTDTYTHLGVNPGFRGWA